MTFLMTMYRVVDIDWFVKLIDTLYGMIDNSLKEYYWNIYVVNLQWNVWDISVDYYVQVSGKLVQI